MFWDTGYSNSANIDALLNKDKCTLQELMEEEDILQECRTQNTKLVKFLSRSEIVDELITYIITEPSLEIIEEKRFLYPNVASEILTSDVPSIKQRIVEDTVIMNKLYSFFENKGPLNPLLASYVTKTFGMLITKKMEQDWFLYQTICLHVIEFIKSKDNFLDSIVQHFSTPVVVDLLLNMLNDIEDAKMKSNFLEWVSEKGLVTILLNELKIPDDKDKHESIAQFLTELIKIGRCSRQNDTEERKALPNPLLQCLENKSTVEQLLDVILCETRTESGILAALQVLLSLLENTIIQEPVSQSALQQIVDAEKEHHDEVVASLMEIIHPRVHSIFELLVNPPMKQLVINDTSGYPLTLGNVRLQLCYLFTVLLETENTSVIDEICKTNFFIELLKLFKQYCWNNFLHNYVKKCLVYGIQAFDTIPDSTELVISALQKHIVVDCKVTESLLDCWEKNEESCNVAGGRRMGYMGHLIEILTAVQSAMSASEEFRALIESGMDEATLERWQSMLKSNDIEVDTQKRFLADCDPSLKQEFGTGIIGYPSNNNEYENDTEEFNYNFNSAMHGAVNGIDFSDDFIGDEDIESRNKMFEEACNQNLSTFSMETNFANWDSNDASNSNLDFPFDISTSLNFKSTSPFHQNENDQNDNNDDPFAEATNGVFNTIIGNENLSNHHFYHHLNGGVGVFGLTNFYQVSPMSITNTNFSLTANTNNQLPSSSSYNPFIVELNDNNAVECNNDNWAAFDSDNFADFDSHFAEFSPVTDNTETGPVTTQTFVATTQTIEITTAPPPPPYESPMKRDFVIGDSTSVNNLIPAMDALELDEVEDEFYSLRDDSNEMSSLTEDKTKNAENTEVPDDDDDDFASADESSSKGNSEEEIIGDNFVDCAVSPTPDAKNQIHSFNGVDSIEDLSSSPPEPNDDAAENSSAQSNKSEITSEKFAQASDSELITSPVVPLENGST